MSHHLSRSRLVTLTASTILALAATLLVTAPPASATGLQTSLLSPLGAGSVSSSPDEATPHHRPYGGDFSFDVAGSGDVYARFRNTNGNLSLTVASVGRACASGNFADGGDRITLNVLINGTKVATVAYAHLTNFSYTSGNVPVGARIGRVVTTGDGVRSNRCWSGSHVHVEPRNDFRYGCYIPGLLGRGVNGDSLIGIVGGERAGAVNSTCPASPETPSGGGGGGVSEGSFVRRPDGAVFRIAGGAPLYVSTWDAFGGPQPYTDISNETFNALSPYPAVNTFLRGSRSGRVFRVVQDGHRYYVPSWDPYGGPQPYVDVDDVAIDSCDHLTCTPFGAFDAATGVPGGVRLTGWVTDPDETTPLEVHAYAGDAIAAVFTAAGSRPDVDAVYHRGDQVGFDRLVALAPGTHSVCVYGINLGPGDTNPRLGCQEVQAQPRTVSAVEASVSRTRVTAGTRVRVSATLRVGANTAPGRMMELRAYQPSTRSWSTLARLSTSSVEGQTGRVSRVVRPSRSTTYQWRYVGDFSTAPSQEQLRVRVP